MCVTPLLLYFSLNCNVPFYTNAVYTNKTACPPNEFNHNLLT